jgi:hypothetical protein
MCDRCPRGGVRGESPDAFPSTGGIAAVPERTGAKLQIAVVAFLGRVDDPVAAKPGLELAIPMDIRG